MDSSAGGVARANGGIAYTPALDGLRAIACLTVFLENLHVEMRRPVSGSVGPFSLPYLATSGVGVAIFIVMSGGLLSVPFWRALLGARPPVALGSFATRRFLRIAPPYYACLILLAIGTGAWRHPGDLVAHFLFVNNLADETFYGISPQFWTIGLFVQLYVLLPLCFALVGRVARTPIAAAAWMSALALASFGLHVLVMTLAANGLAWPFSVVMAPDGYALSHSTLAHLPLFLFGVVAGYVIVKRLAGASTHDPEDWSAKREIVAWASLAVIAFFAASPSVEALAVPYGRYLFPWLPLAIAVAIASIPFAPSVRRILGAPPLQWLGVISYGVYIYHVTCMNAVRRALDAAGAGAMGTVQYALLSLAFTIAVAVVSYVVLERPAQRWAS